MTSQVESVDAAYYWRMTLVLSNQQFWLLRGDADAGADAWLMDVNTNERKCTQPEIICVCICICICGEYRAAWVELYRLAKHTFINGVCDDAQLLHHLCKSKHYLRSHAHTHIVLDHWTISSESGQQYSHTFTTHILLGKSPIFSKIGKCSCWYLLIIVCKLNAGTCNQMHLKDNLTWNPQ